MVFLAKNGEKWYFKSKNGFLNGKTAISAQFWLIFGNVSPNTPIKTFVFDCCVLYASGRKQAGGINCNLWTYALHFVKKCVWGSVETEESLDPMSPTANSGTGTSSRGQKWPFLLDFWRVFDTVSPIGE